MTHHGLGLDFVTHVPCSAEPANVFMRLPLWTCSLASFLAFLFSFFFSQFKDRVMLHTWGNWRWKRSKDAGASGEARTCIMHSISIS